MQLKIRRRDGVESLSTLEEGEFKVPIDVSFVDFKSGFQNHPKTTKTYFAFQFIT